MSQSTKESRAKRMARNVPRNFVAKNDFNKAKVIPAKNDYKRKPKHRNDYYDET